MCVGRFYDKIKLSELCKSELQKNGVFFMAITCPKCGKLNPDDARFCWNDGEKLVTTKSDISLRAAFPLPTSEFPDPLAFSHP